MSNEPSLNKIVSNRRKELGLTQNELASSLGYTSQAISKFEKSGSSFPVTTLPSLANILHCNIGYLFGYEQNPGEGTCQNIDTKVLADNLRYCREKSGLSIPKAAEKLGVSERSLSNYENDHAVMMTSTFSNILSLYNIEPEQFLYESLQAGSPIINNEESSTPIVPDESSIVTKQSSKPKRKIFVPIFIFAIVVVVAVSVPAAIVSLRRGQSSDDSLGSTSQYIEDSSSSESSSSSLSSNSSSSSNNSSASSENPSSSSSSSTSSESSSSSSSSSESSSSSSSSSSSTASGTSSSSSSSSNQGTPSLPDSFTMEVNPLDDQSKPLTNGDYTLKLVFPDGYTLPSTGCESDWTLDYNTGDIAVSLNKTAFDEASLSVTKLNYSSCQITIKVTITYDGKTMSKSFLKSFYNSVDVSLPDIFPGLTSLYATCDAIKDNQIKIRTSYTFNFVFISAPGEEFTFNMVKSAIKFSNNCSEASSFSGTDSTCQITITNDIWIGETIELWPMIYSLVGNHEAVMGAKLTLTGISPD